MGTALRRLFLPLGMHLSQTSLVSLPYPATLAIPPDSVGLERVIALMRRLCPGAVVDQPRHNDLPGMSVIHEAHSALILSLLQQIFGVSCNLVCAAADTVNGADCSDLNATGTLGELRQFICEDIFDHTDNHSHAIGVAILFLSGSLGVEEELHLGSLEI